MFNSLRKERANYIDYRNNSSSPSYLLGNENWSGCISWHNVEKKVSRRRCGRNRAIQCFTRET